MESIAALGLACNIFQVISVGHETIRLVKDIYNKGSIESPLAEYSVSLRDISSHINALELSQKAPQYQIQLKENAAKCHAVSRDLAEEISFLLVEKAKGDLLKTLKTAAKTTWRKRRLERFERQLKDLEKQMQSGLLTRLVDNSNTIQLRQEALGEHIRYLLQQYHDGKTQASELILKDGATTRAHMLRESSKLQRQVDSATQASAAQVMSLMSNLDLKRVDSARLGQFIESLAFHGMNERRNHATDSHEGTSKWIFFPYGESFSEEDDSDINFDGDDLTHYSQRWDCFGDWLRSSEQVYWISGKPGSGKTTLTKYILNHPNTKDLLGIWQPNPTLVSHFFWRPGTHIQHNIKGMLCSILYQLLRYSHSSTELAMSQTDTTKRPDNVCGDWSSRELQKILSSVLQQYQRPVFLVVDGLDEVDPSDGIIQLLSLLEELQKHKNVKMCLSSRPEPLLRRLSKHPHLQLQDFTLHDLHRYTRDRLHPFHEYITKAGDFDHQHEYMYPGRTPHQLFVELLVKKSEGVFLWLHLALNTTIRGIEQGDSIEDVYARINSLPRTLVDLYKDMWQRLNDDTLIYKRRAAFYFRLMILAEKFKPILHIVLAHTPFRIALETSSLGQRILDDGPTAVTAPEIQRECEATERDIQLRCAGLVELVSNEHPLRDPFQAWAWLPAKSVKKDPTAYWNNNQLMNYIRGETNFSFIHRSAYDFLTDTSHGQEILFYEKESNDDLPNRLISASLAACRICSYIGLPQFVKIPDTRERYTAMTTNRSEIFLKWLKLIESFDAFSLWRDENLSASWGPVTLSRLQVQREPNGA